MAIPESQLETWSHQGSVKQSSTTYATIKRALEASDTKYATKEFEVFLQGSYGNDTNIYAESDVDVVIRLDSMFYYSLDALTPAERADFETAYPGTATYTYSEFKNYVASALEKSFEKPVTPGQSAEKVVGPGKKAIKIKAEGNRRSADVVPACQYRRYRNFSIFNTEDFEKGICFFTASWHRVVNYPKQHSDNCTAKHQATVTWFKPTVRILKNLRNKLIDGDLLEEGIAPSYFLKGLLYNVPKDKFGRSYGDTIVNSFNWILKADRSKFVCANEQYYLIGDSSAVQWPAANCDLFLVALKQLWNGWA